MKVSTCGSITVWTKEPTEQSELVGAARNAPALARVESEACIQEDPMAIPNETVTQNEIEEKRRQEDKEEFARRAAAQSRKFARAGP